VLLDRRCGDGNLKSKTMALFHVLFLLPACPMQLRFAPNMLVRLGMFGTPIYWHGRDDLPHAG